MFGRFRRSDRGASAIEYAILAALVSIVALSAIRTTGVGVNALFNRVATATNVSPAAVDPAVAVLAQAAALEATVWTQSGATQNYGPPPYKIGHFTSPDGRYLTISSYADGRVFETFYDAAVRVVFQTSSDSTGAYQVTGNKTYDSGGVLQSQTTFTYSPGTNTTSVYALANGASSTTVVSGAVGNTGNVVDPSIF